MLAARVIRYEHPLNERIRTMMRLEGLYGRALFFSEGSSPADHHAALIALFEITDVASRADLKTDLSASATKSGWRPTFCKSSKGSGSCSRH